jgi:hypothetical protein
LGDERPVGLDQNHQNVEGPRAELNRHPAGEQPALPHQDAIVEIRRSGQPFLNSFAARGTHLR